MSIDLNETINKVKTAGLHEVAKREHGTAVTLKLAAALLGAELYYLTEKYARIQNGLDSLALVEDDVEVTKTASESISLLELFSNLL